MITSRYDCPSPTKSFIRGNAATLLYLAIVAICMMALVLATTINVHAQGPGDLLIAPTRVVFEGAQNNATLSLINMGTDTAAYVISAVNYRMTETGEFQEIATPDSGQFFADKIIRYFPRQVVLAPREEQVVRIQLMKPAGLSSGEYRSHLYFRAVPRAKPVEATTVDTSAKGIAISLTPVYGIAIPVIVRNGDLTASVTVSNTSVSYDGDAPTIPKLNFTLERNGNSSTYGEIVVTYVPTDGQPVVVGQVKGLAIYTPNSRRTYRGLPLTVPGGAKLTGGRLLVEYRGKSDLKESLLGKTEISLQ